MNVLGLDHINISGRKPLIEECRDFYVNVLGLHEGHRPSFRTAGFWLYAGERAVVHLTVRERETSISSNSAFDHCALSCSGLESAVERLKRHSVAYTIKQVPGSGDAQIFLKDPGGLELELNFRSGE